jgi:predicted PurR-regulated permease PerM
MTLALTAAVIVPTASIISLLSTEVGEAYRATVATLSQQRQLPPAILKLPLIGGWLGDLNQRMQNDPQALRETLQGLLGSSLGELRTVVGGVGRNLGKLFITVISLFFFYRDGESLASQAQGVLQQILGNRVRNYMDAIGKTVKSVLLSLLLVAVSQGVLAGLGYWVTGVPAPMFSAAVTAVAALIPFAVPVVWGSIVIWMFAAGQTWPAFWLLLWCATAVSWVDNVIRPMVIGNSTGIPFLLVMFGVLGGLGAFGMVGLFVGPAVLAVLLAVWREWRAERSAVPEAGD